ncbi:MAG: hypothetical protein JWO03_2228 [Bacteroidetes bacterium]|nr:hypothetical protein [Bacteroidota bacterium]
MKAVYLVGFIGLILLCGCWRDKPRHYVQMAAATVIEADAPFPPMHTTIDTTVAGHRFRIVAGIEDSAYKLYVQYNNGWDSFSNPMNADTFADDGILFYRDTEEVYKGFRFLNDSMVVIRFPSFVFEHFVWVVYQSQHVGMKRISGGVSGPYPLYLDEHGHRIISIGSLIVDDPDQSHFHRDVSIYDYVHDKHTIREWRDSTAFFKGNFKDIK